MLSIKPHPKIPGLCNSCEDMILSLSHNIHFQAQHIPGVANTAADLLSRLQVPEFLIRFPNMDKTPTLVPASHVKI